MNIHTSRSDQIFIAILIALALFTLGASTSQENEKSDRSAEEESRDEFNRMMRPEGDNELRKKIIVFSQMTLGRLGYGLRFDGSLNEATKAALKEFQRDANLKPTGELDWDSFSSLSERDQALNSPSIILPGRWIHFGMWDSFVTASGTWSIEGQEQGFPLQTTELRCDRQAMLCTEATTILADHTGSGSPILSIEIERHGIERWDEHEIVTKPDEKVCVRYTMRFSRRTSDVTGLRLKTSDDSRCEGFEDELRLRLIDGTEAMKAYRATQRKNWEHFKLSPEIRKSLLGDD